MSFVVRDVRGMAAPDVLAILPHYGEPADSREAIAALLGSGYPALRIVVVDNSDNWPVEDAVERVEVLRPGSNVGYCAAVNLGVARALHHGSDLVLLVNNDTTLGPGVIEGMVDAVLADESVAGVGPLLTMDEGRTIWAAGSFVRFGPNEVRQRGLGRPVHTAPPFPSEVDFLPGALALYRTHDLIAVGGVDDEYFMYLEDVDLGWRLRQAGRRLLYLPWLRAHHGGSISSGGGVTPLRKFLNGVNTPRLLRRYRSSRLWLSFLLFDVIGLVPSIVMHLGNRRRVAAQIAKGRGILLGLVGYRPGPRDVAHYCRAEADG